MFFQLPLIQQKKRQKYLSPDVFLATQNKKSTTSVMLFFVFGGERGIRTPGPVKINGFQDRRIRPLCHLSSDKSTAVFLIDQIFFKKFFKKNSPTEPKCSLSAKKVCKKFCHLKNITNFVFIHIKSFP